MGIQLKTSPKAIEIAQRKVQIFELRIRGFSYREIAKQIGCRQSYCFKVVDNELQAIALKLEHETKQLRTLECEKLDLLETKLYAAVKGGDPQAIKTMIVIQERRARLLGLDAPTRIEVPPIEVTITPPPLPEPADA